MRPLLLVGNNGAVHVSARVDYGTRALVELADAWKTDPRKLTKGDDLARAQDIPAKFLEGILRHLRQAGLVASQRGADGGYRLDRDPAQITIADIVRALDGPLAAVRDMRPEDVHYRGSADHLREVWVALRAAMREVLEHTSLADVQAGKLPPQVSSYLENPEAWQRR
jgi:Rrf2 family protein